MSNSEERIQVTGKCKQTWRCYGEESLIEEREVDFEGIGKIDLCGPVRFFLTHQIPHKKYFYNDLSFLSLVSSLYQTPAPWQVSWQAFAFQSVVRILCSFIHVSMWASFLELD